ncbi:MAG TPA: hypothetical protein PLL33_06840 [Paracoccus sp. (in: a-proteobacteria)]|nr:hypothetical protein [Paracoccus sp. (in: a-proteobacteria)]
MCWPRARDHHSFAKTTDNSGRINAALKEGRIGLAQAFDALDAAPLDVACETGILRFSVLGGEPDDGFAPVADMAMVPHARDLRITKLMPVAYDPDARAPQFEAFLQRDPAIWQPLHRYEACPKDCRRRR